MGTKTKRFDAVSESRKWKESVAAKTEGLTSEQTVSYFEYQAVRRRFDEVLRRAKRARR